MILNTILAGSLLAALGFPQNTVPVVFDDGALVRGTVDRTMQMSGRRTFPHRGQHPDVDATGSARPSLLVYVITGGGQFGVVDLRSGTFLPIGTGLPPDIGGGLVAGPGKSLLTLSFSGNLEAIDPATGATSVVGPTGLGDCTTPSSPCGLNSANGIGRLGGTLYAMDFGNNLYTVNATTGAAKLIGPTGIPAVPFVPFSSNPDGSLNVYAESLFSRHGKLYANFGTAALNPETGTVKTLIPGAIYEIDRNTGHATLISPTDTNLTSIVEVNATIYAFNAATGQVVTLDVTTGQIAPVTDLDAAAALIGGATPARPVPSDRP